MAGGGSYSVGWDDVFWGLCRFDGRQYENCARLYHCEDDDSRELKTFMRPSAVIQPKMGEKPIEPCDYCAYLRVLSIFVLVFALGSFIMTFFTPNLETAATSVIATLGNVGPGLNAVRATQNYAAIPVAGQAFF